LNKQIVISRDNAQLYLDAILCFKVVNARQMIYSTQNLPEMLSKLLQVLNSLLAENYPPFFSFPLPSPSLEL